MFTVTKKVASVRYKTGTRIPGPETLSQSLKVGPGTPGVKVRPKDPF